VKLACSPGTSPDSKVVTVTSDDEIMALSQKIDAGDARPKTTTVSWHCSRSTR